ncbi:MAG: hypothetical protein E7115_08860 [Bacteroidales bacterium]|nr:hypothetical protein [Bacteroidales bacterium]
MKKIMIMIAAVSLLVACGGNSKKDDKKKDDKPATEQTKQTLSVEDQAVAFCEAYANAETEAEQAKIDEEVEKWMESLSEEDQMKAAIAMTNWLEEFGEDF